jgi:hypothetical protein
VSRHPYEIEIGRYFCSPPLSKDPANHCVPIYDVLKVPTDDNLAILVMPLLRDATDPFFDTVGEVVDCVHQLFEVIAYSITRAHHDLFSLSFEGTTLHAQASCCSPVRNLVALVTRLVTWI